MPPLTFSIQALAMLAAIVAAIAFVSRGNASANFARPAAAPPSLHLTPSRAAKTPVPPAIVIGFVGGYVSSDNIHHAEVQLAATLRKAYPAGVDVETYQNHHYEDAHQRILTLLDVDHDGKLSPEAKKAARIVLYGHSWGAAAVLALARELNVDEIPVRLTIQVDSVASFHQNDSVIPPNVEKAVNFYQPHGKLHGQKEITAADPERTKIIGNFEFDYSKDPIKCKGYPWWDRYFANPHTEIECDPKVWAQIEDMVRAELPPSPSPSS
jgi:pimeloyl-ACP methyl ester carboxylesterase